jgi:hypothetical protein
MKSWGAVLPMHGTVLEVLGSARSNTGVPACRNVPLPFEGGLQPGRSGRSFRRRKEGRHAARWALSRRGSLQKQSAPGFLPAPPCQIRTGCDSDIRRASRLAGLDFDGPARSRPEATSVLEPHRPNPRGFCTVRHRRTFPAFMALIGPPSALARFKRPRRSRLRLPAGKPAFRRAVRASSVPRGRFVLRRGDPWPPEMG